MGLKEENGQTKIVWFSKLLFYFPTLFNNLDLYLVTASSSAESGVDMMTKAAPARFNSKTASSKVRLN